MTEQNTHINTEAHEPAAVVDDKTQKNKNKHIGIVIPAAFIGAVVLVVCILVAVY